MLHPIILELYILRNSVFYLEKYLDAFGESDQWPSGIYEETLFTTDKFYKVRDKAIKILGSDVEVDNCVYLLDKRCGEV